ncbi:hypothetical protein ACMHYB_35285 [Sorangium sp. So ce1128]
MNASSHEALLSQLRSWPAYSHHDFEIYPLCNIFQVIDDNFGRVRRPRAMRKGSRAGRRIPALRRGAGPGRVAERQSSTPYEPSDATWRGIRKRPPAPGAPAASGRS